MTFDITLTPGAILGRTTINLSRMMTEHTPRTTVEIGPIEHILTAICREFHVERTELLSKSREARIVWPRQIGMALAYELSGCTLTRIGSQFGGRDHGTVMHANQKVKDRCDTDKRSREQVERVKGMLA